MRGPSGRLELFALGSDRSLWCNWQLTPNGSWNGWVPFSPGRTWRGSPAVAANQDGRLEVFVEGDDRQIWHAWQSAPNGAWTGSTWWPFPGTTSV